MKQSGAYERVFLGIAVTVTVVWAMATLAQVVSPAHIVPTYANLVMMSVAGSFFGGAILSAKRSTNGPKKPDARSIIDAALDRGKEKP